MAKVEEEVSTAAQNAGADDADGWRGTRARRSRTHGRRATSWCGFCRSAVGKKWVMAVTGIILLGFVLAHMIGNLKLYLGKEEINLYGEGLRDARRARVAPHRAALDAAHRADRARSSSTSTPRTSSRG